MLMLSSPDSESGKLTIEEFYYEKQSTTKYRQLQSVNVRSIP
jgi:hypothetical protein